MPGDGKAYFVCTKSRLYIFPTLLHMAQHLRPMTPYCFNKVGITTLEAQQSRTAIPLPSPHPVPLSNQLGESWLQYPLILAPRATSYLVAPTLEFLLFFLLRAHHSQGLSLLRKVHIFILRQSDREILAIKSSFWSQRSVKVFPCGFNSLAHRT